MHKLYIRCNIKIKKGIATECVKKTPKKRGPNGKLKKMLEEIALKDAPKRKEIHNNTKEECVKDKIKDNFFIIVNKELDIVCIGGNNDVKLY